MDSYERHLVEHIRETTRKGAQNLRELADRIDRLADSERVERIPGEINDALTWGLANCRLELPAVWNGELSMHRSAAVAQEEVEEA